MRRALVIFARTPEAEARAKRLPLAVAAPLFASIIARWVRAAHDAKAEAIIACAPEHKARLARIAPHASWIEQPSGCFGERLSAVVTAAFAQQFDVVAITGIDTPPLDLTAIFECGRNVIVPARDGGVNLIALIADAPDVLASLRPRQRDAAARCEALLRAVVLPTLPDLDGNADLDDWLCRGAVPHPLRVAVASFEPTPFAPLRGPPRAA